MNSQGCVIRAIEFKGPDSIPWMHYFLPEVALGGEKEVQAIFDRYPSDFGIDGEADRSPIYQIERGEGV